MALPPVAAVNCAAPTVRERVVDWRMSGLVISLAVTDAVPVAVKVTLKGKERVPAAIAALAGRLALASEEVMATRSVAVFTGFQFASTPLTVMVKGLPAV